MKTTKFSNRWIATCWVSVVLGGWSMGCGAPAEDAPLAVDFGDDAWVEDAADALGRAQSELRADPCVHARSGAGAYCGQSIQFPYGEDGTLYWCDRQADGSMGTSSEERCSGGCERREKGKNDRCRPAPTGEKSIVVDLSDQWLYAFEGSQRVHAAPVSTGRDGFNTPQGPHSILWKTPLRTMRGCRPSGCWTVPDVPWVMYIDSNGVALHGAYWHNKFGTGARLSHGCVNLPVPDAKWLFEWAPTGTEVLVRR